MLQLSHLPRLAPLHCEHANGHFSTFSTTKAARRGSAPLKGGGCHLLLAPPWRDGVPLSLPYLLELLESFWSTFSSEAHCNLRRPPTCMCSVDLNVVTCWMTAIFFIHYFSCFFSEFIKSWYWIISRCWSIQVGREIWYSIVCMKSPCKNLIWIL